MVRIYCSKAGGKPSQVLVQAADSSPLDGELILFADSVPLHPHSPQAFFAAARPDAISYFVPTIPVASEIGMPKYEPLMIFVPDDVQVQRELLLQHPFAPLHLGRETGLFMHKVEGNSLQEQKHYFVDHLNAICPLPLQISVVVSNKCNLSCIMCPYHGGQARRKHARDYFDKPMFMDRDLLFSIADKVGGLGIPIKMGNIEEPLLHQDTPEFVSRARDAGSPSSHITTNGVLLTSKRADDLLDAGLTSLYVSLDAANQETYAKIRGGELAKVEYQVLDFIHKAKKLTPSCTVMVSCVLNQELGRDEAEIFSEKWLCSADGVIFYNLAGYEEGSSVFSDIHGVAQKKVREYGKRWPCLNPWQEVYILPDGQCLYCCETLSQLSYLPLQTMGSIHESSLADIWLGESFGDLRRSLIRNELGDWPACAKCNIWMAHVCETEETGSGKTVRNMITEIRYAE